MTEDEQTKVFDYLIELRDSGETNMFGAGVYLQEEFGFSRIEARNWLMKWMRSFDDEE